MSVPIPASVYAAIAERMGLVENRRDKLYTGPTDAAEFLHAVREPMREWCKVIDNAERLSEIHWEFYHSEDGPYVPSSAWVAYVLNEEDKVRALAAAMGIEVEA